MSENVRHRDMPANAPSRAADNGQRDKVWFVAPCRSACDLVNSNGVVLRSNNNWRDSQEAAITATGLQPPDDREAALAATVAPGNYTAIVRGVGNTTGIGLVEVYNVQ
jgi:hypothetical protein